MIREVEFEHDFKDGRIVSGTATGDCIQVPSDEGRGWEVTKLKITAKVYQKGPYDYEECEAKQSLFSVKEWEQIEASAVWAMTGGIDD